MFKLSLAKKFIFLLLVLLPTTPIHGQTKMVSSNVIKIKTMDKDHADAQFLIKGKLLDGKKEEMKFTLGYGSLIGKGWNEKTSDWGLFTSGLAGSELYPMLSKSGIGNVSDLGWGRNGLNFSFDGSLDKLSIGGAYSGYTDQYSFNLSTLGSGLVGRANIIGRGGRIEQLRADLEIKL